MITFICRFVALFFMFCVIAFSFLLLFLGFPNKTDWVILIQPYYEDLSLLLILISTISTISLLLSLWMTAIGKIQLATATRHIKQLIEPNFTIKNKHYLSHSMKRALLQANELIETQKQSLQRLSNEKVEAHDNLIQERIIAERQRLARELHDSVSQQLFAASMLLSSMTETEEDFETYRKMLPQVEKIVQQAQLEMRALLLHLRPIALRNNTLAQGLTELIVELQQKVHFHIDYKIEEIELSKAEEDHLFRIAQEALSNTLRHAKATEIELLLVKRDAFGILRIQDNGQGFHHGEDKNTSYGLKNIAERAVEIGCTYKIVSIPGEGTIVEVKVPLLKQRFISMDTAEHSSSIEEQ